MDNYKVKIIIEKTIFIEEVSSKAEAIRKASGFVTELLTSGINPFAKITATKTNNIEKDSEPLLDEQIIQVQQTSLELSNNFNNKELKLLVEDLKFYIGA